MKDKLMNRFEKLLSTVFNLIRKMVIINRLLIGLL